MTAMDFTMVSYDETKFKERLKRLYPAVNEEETPFPKKWSAKDKFTFIGLSQDDLKVQYKGLGKTHRDAASVRADHSIPASCGIYYFEAKIISKGRDGYMGIGLSAQGVNLNRLPGWDKQSYGYHGDDGHSFCSSGTGRPYGPTFTTGDVVGCCVNLVDGSCFYTKNGVNIGIAFKDLPNIPLYPMVGLQTPKEEVYANFGQHPFMFDIEDYIQQWRIRTRLAIKHLDVPDDSGQFQTTLHRLVSTYLIHHGYAATAESFSRSVDLGWGEHNEDLISIKNRQKIQRLVLAGHLSEAIETTQRLFPGLLERNQNLLFMLKVRQFIELVNGTETEMRSLSRHSSSSGKGSPGMSPNPTTWHKSVSSSPTSSHSDFSQAAHKQPSYTSENHSHFPHGTNVSLTHLPASPSGDAGRAPTGSPCLNSDDKNFQIANSTANADSSTESDSDMETDSEDQQPSLQGGLISNGSTVSSQSQARIVNGETFINGVASRDNALGSSENGTMETENDDNSAMHKKLCGGNKNAILQMLAFGTQLSLLSNELKKEHGQSVKNKRMLEVLVEQSLNFVELVRMVQQGPLSPLKQHLAWIHLPHLPPEGGMLLYQLDAYSLLAYSDPWSSSVGYQLDPVQREPVCAALNSAILESQNLPRTPPLLMAIAHAQQCVKRMAKSNIGACAFVSVSDYLR